MIGPDMGPLHATMLAFLTTDAKIEKPLLQELLENAVERSFNSVTVDGDTSTNDTALLLASGASGVEITSENRDHFAALLQAVCIHLTRDIARDGEGATKLVTVEVSGAGSEAEAKRIALTVANSPLVKTAIYGRDPNWGRICAAAGRAGVAFDASKLNVSLGEVAVFRNGEPLEFDVDKAVRVMSANELTIHIQLGEGTAAWTAWTCDFSYDYVKINAEYHT
jgi:glutamate N-acetyltransferase/amino-acid N-acetyltransferase